jgi:signal transduction histidine kinase
VAEIVLAFVALAALLISLVLGVAQSSRILGVLEAEERWRTAGLIASGITHDLGHRLAILQQTAALAETNDPLFLPQIRDNLSAEVATLRRFVADFADLTRPAQPAEFLPLDLDAFLRSVCATAAPLAARMEIELVRDACDAPPWTLGDRYLIERATLNLIHNALEASPRGASVHVRVAREGESAIIQVIDRGVGIAADRLPHLFDAFASTKRTGAHIGVGLPNVRRIARAHGGDVSAISEAGKGATFTIRLPLAPAPQESRT